jgi:type II secretory ATPase GspE/PulE/Tfp pilus assembly ATPase PilB-like protein
LDENQGSSNSTLTVAFANPLDHDSQRAIEFETDLRVKVAIASEEHIQCCLSRKLPDIESEFRNFLAHNQDSEISLSASTTQLESNLVANDKDDASVIRLVNRILAEGVQANASDIHISPEREQLEVRIRVDGILRPLLAIPSKLQAAVSSRIKLLAGMDISEKRRSQDGRLRIKTPLGPRDLRLSSIPTANGENIVIRILSSDLGQISFDSLGLQPTEQTQLKRALTGSSRVVLVTGPTGSGKTSTLYASLISLKDGKTNIITIEDPIEYRIAGLNQTQVNTKIGVSFAEGLRAVLRQDPDVVMVGEIRDHETAQIAFQAAQTGRLVLSALHTNSASATVVRLRDIGLPSYIIASSLGAILAQRLVRKLCLKCCKAEEPERVRKFESLGLIQCGQV